MISAVHAGEFLFFRASSERIGGIHSIPPCLQPPPPPRIVDRSRRCRRPVLPTIHLHAAAGMLSLILHRFAAAPLQRRGSLMRREVTIGRAVCQSLPLLEAYGTSDRSSTLLFHYGLRVPCRRKRPILARMPSRGRKPGASRSGCADLSRSLTRYSCLVHRPIRPTAMRTRTKTPLFLQKSLLLLEPADVLAAGFDVADGAGFFTTSPAPPSRAAAAALPPPPRSVGAGDHSGALPRRVAPARWLYRRRQTYGWVTRYRRGETCSAAAVNCSLPLRREIWRGRRGDEHTFAVLERVHGPMPSTFVHSHGAYGFFGGAACMMEALVLFPIETTPPVTKRGDVFPCGCSFNTPVASGCMPLIQGTVNAQGLVERDQKWRFRSQR